MKNCLFSIGSFSRRALTTICSAVSCGAAAPVSHLDIFQIDFRQSPELVSSLTEDLTACHHLLCRGENSLPTLFPAAFSFQSCVAVLPQAREFLADEDSALLFAALRGKGMPLSFRTDREEVEWAFSALLYDHKNESCDALQDYISMLQAGLSEDPGLRLAILYDPADSFSAGVAAVLLPFLRNSLSGDAVSIILISMPETESPLPDSFLPDFRASLRILQNRSLLGISDGCRFGADALVLTALPASLAGNPESHRLVFLSAARSLASFFTNGIQDSDLHVGLVDGALSLSSLKEDTHSFVTFLLAASWLLSDLLPALRNQVSRPGRLRSLQLNPRTALLKNVLSVRDSAVLPVLERSLKTLLSETVFLINALPDALCPSAENDARWQRISDACGRYITVASEYDVARAEFEESGLANIRPVHRDSMADTSDERLQRRLDDMKNQLESESASLDEMIALTNPVHVIQAEQDCMLRCRSALSAAEDKLSGQPADTDHLTLARMERRVRLLKAAVARCETDLTKRLPKSGDFSAKASSVPADARILNHAFLSALNRLLQEDSEASCRNTREAIPGMLEGCSLPEIKDLLRDLAISAKKNGYPDSLPSLIHSVWDICSFRVSNVSPAPVDSHLPAVPLLPSPVLTDSLYSLSSLLSSLPDRETDPLRSEAEMRGLVAMLLLRQYRRRVQGEAVVGVFSVETSAPLPRYWLSARHSGRARVIFLSSEDQSRVPFALVIPGVALFPAKRTREHAALIPSFVSWYDAESGSFRDPCDYLSEGNRALLLSLLTEMSDKAGSARTPLARFLASFRLALSKEPAAEPDPDLRTRVKAVCGLMHLSAYADSLRRVPCFYEHFLSEDPVASALTGRDDFPASDCVGFQDDVVYTWRGIPFAREDSRLMLKSTLTPEEAYTLHTLEDECRTLSGISDDYRDALTREASLLLERFPDALTECRSTVQRIVDKASAPLPDQSPELVWPWDPLSPSILTVLHECLGDALAPAAVRPFSDLLAVFPARGGDVIRDTLFGPMCCMMPFVSGITDPLAVMQADAVLPPLSPELTAAVCRTAEGRVLLSPDMIHFERPDETSCKVTLTLNGSFALRLTRTYADEEILRLYSNDIPTIALWPSVPLPPDLWHIYFVYAHLPESMHISMLSDTSEKAKSVDDPVALRSVTSLSSFPSAFLFSWNQQSMGALPNLLPSPRIESGNAVTACIDFGSVGTSVVFAGNSGRKPLHGPTMVRTILNNPAASQDLLRQEFLPAIPVSALLPTASRIFRNVPGASPVPFADGIVLMSANLQDLLSTPSDALYTCLKWEEEKGRSGFLCLHQVMLMAALQARMDGAETLAWRFAIPDEMAREGRESLLALFCKLSQTVLSESGFPVPEESPPVSFASESSALGAYFRYCAWEDTRGGFMVTDIGACTVDISLFLRGREQAVRSCQIPLGVHYMFLPSLLRDPEMLFRDFGAYPDPAFRADLDLLTRILSAARTDPVSLRKARMSLDHFLADYYPLLIDALGQLSAAGMVSRFGALLLLHLSYLMMLSGLVLLQIAVDPNKNDFLPEQMTLCLSGRGALLLESLPDSLKTALWRFLTMFRNKRVASMSLLFSAEKKMEIPVGLSMLENLSSQLPPASAVPSSLSVRPEELLPEFLLRFARVFPVESQLLLPDFFTGDFYHPFSQLGEAAVTAAITQSFAESETPRPYDSLAAWIGNLLEYVSPGR